MNTIKWLGVLLLSGICGCATGQELDLTGVQVRRTSLTRYDLGQPLFYSSIGTLIDGGDDDAEDHVVVRVYYATDRLRTGETEPSEVFGDEPNHRVELGYCEVSIPSGHEAGELDELVLFDLTRLVSRAFNAKLRESIGESSRRQAFVFIHGFNTSFEGAALRTAQLYHDLDVDGAAIMYTWPSRYKAVPGGWFGSARDQYQRDEDYMMGALPQIRDFLERVVTESGAKEVHVLAQSMGNRVLTFALEALAAEMSATSKPMFRQVILMAPDINADVFKRTIAPAMRTSEHLALYSSSKDWALRISKKWHDEPRAGDSGNSRVVMPGIQTIDVSWADTSIIGHSHYEIPAIVEDLRKLIHDDTAARNLKQRDWHGLPYWELQRE